MHSVTHQGEEIAGQQGVFVMIQERAPGGRTFPDGQGRNAMASEYLADAFVADAVTQLPKLALDLAITPLVFAGQTQD